MAHPLGWVYLYPTQRVGLDDSGRVAHPLDPVGRVRRVNQLSGKPDIFPGYASVGFLPRLFGRGRNPTYESEGCYIPKCDDGWFAL